METIIVKKNHSIFSPSSAEKWFNCSASLAMESGLPDKISKYSMEGSVAHKIAEKILKNIIFLKKNKDKKRKIKAIEYINTFPLSKNKKNNLLVTEEMAIYIQQYINDICFFAKTGKLFVEQRVNFSEFISIDKQYGTADVIIIDKNQLQIHDLKYGFVKVDAKKNKQLQLYALGALKKFDKKFSIKTIKIFIHQPRLNCISIWETNVEKLIEFGKKAKLSAIQAILAINISQYKGINELSKNMFKPGIKQCRWCKASGGKCKAEAIYFLKLIDNNFSKHNQITNFKINNILNNQELSHLYNKIKYLNTFLKSIKKRVITELSMGINIPGLKLVYNRYGPRVWKNEILAVKILKKIITDSNQLYEKKLVSPAKAEKIINKFSPHKWVYVKDLIDKSKKTPTVVYKKDKK